MMPALQDSFLEETMENTNKVVKSAVATLIAAVLQWVLNIGLIILAIILVIFLGKETLHLANVLFHTGEESSSYLLVEGIVIYFLYFEFIALIV